MLRVLLLTLAVAGLVEGQSTTFQRVLTGYTNGTTTVTLKNVGQSSHQIVGIAWCTSGGAVVTLYGDVIGTFTHAEPATFGPTTMLIASAPGLSGAAEEFSASGVGLYPVLKVNATASAGCALDVWYIGTVAPAIASNVNLQKVGGNTVATTTLAVTSGDTAPVVSGGYALGGGGLKWNPLQIAGTGASTNVSTMIGSVQPITACDKRGVISVNAAATGLIAANPLTGTTVRICSLVLSGSAADTTAEIVETTVGGCTNPATLSGVLQLGKATVSMGSGLGQILTTSTVDKSVCLAAVTGNVTGFITYTAY